MIAYDLSKIRAMAFDVDGVLSSPLVMLISGQPTRTANIKDGYALQLAVKRGFDIAIVTGGSCEKVRESYRGLGIKDIFMGLSVKINVMKEWMKEKNLSPEEVLYMGDDIPDYQTMRFVGCSCCPHDAAEEIKEIATYVSPYAGGQGCVRDVVRQVLVAHGCWMTDDKAFGW